MLSALSRTSMRGFYGIYRSDQVNYCPGCGRTHWHIGRLTAECAFCATALPLKDAPMTGRSSVITRGRPR